MRKRNNNKYVIVTTLKDIFSDLIIASDVVVTGAVVPLLFGSQSGDTDIAEIELALTDCNNSKAVSDAIRSVLSAKIIDEAMSISGPIFSLKGESPRENIILRLNTEAPVQEGTIKNFLGIIMRVAL